MSAKMAAVSLEAGRIQPVLLPPLPRSIWLVAWASLLGQVVALLRRGVRVDDEVSLIGSVVLGALIVGYVSLGVIRARTVRLVIAWIVLMVNLVGGLVRLNSLDSSGDAVLAAVSLATTGVALAGLASFRRSEWYAWQRTRPSRREGTAVAGLVTIGVLVGVLGGLIAPFDGGLDATVSVTDR